MTYNREVERKFICTDKTFEDLDNILFQLADDVTAIDTSTDQFWLSSNVDFVRLRHNSNELTVKVTDKGTVTDRIEENVVVTDESIPASQRLLTLLFGPPCLALTKRFAVYNIGNTVVSLYSVKEDVENRVFVEVEAIDIESVDEVSDTLKDIVSLTTETRSLFQIFAGKPVTGE